MFSSFLSALGFGRESNFPQPIGKEDKVFMHESSGYLYVQEIQKFSDGSTVSNIFFDGNEAPLNLDIKPENMSNMIYIGEL